VKQTLAERILGEGEVHRLLTLEAHPRNHALLRLLYAGALRVSELCALSWRDLQPRDDAGQVTVFGKGGKTRAVLLTPGVWAELMALRGGAGEGDPVFRSGKRGPLTAVQVHRLVKAAAARAGLSPAVSGTGCATPTPRTRSTAARRSPSCRPRSAMPPSPRPGAICMRGRTTARHGICRSELSCGRPPGGHSGFFSGGAGLAFSFV
jgi:hypothetical protein